MLQCKIILDIYVALHIYRSSRRTNKQPEIITMKPFDNVQNFGKEGFEAFVASATAMTKGFQSMAQEASEYSRKAVEVNASNVEKLVAARSFERVVEVQQLAAKDVYETSVANATKLGEIYVAAAKEAYKPFETSLAAFGFKPAA